MYRSVNPIDGERYPALFRLSAAALDVWPEHDRFLARRFPEGDDTVLAEAEEIAGRVLQICPGRIAALAQGYRWMCEAFQEEALYFFRTGHYQRSTFAEADAWVYQNSRHMSLYLDGMLVALVLWRNHTDAVSLYRHRFLDTAAPGSDHLEVGPGHGLLLAYAAETRYFRRVCGWDVSPSSLARTGQLMKMLSPVCRVELRQIDFLSSSESAAFDSIVLSEVLEHLENPNLALTRLNRLLRPGGRVFLNVPVNSPAPDHIHLFSTPAEVEKMVRDAGFDMEETHLLPATGLTLERAQQEGGTISVVSVLRRQG